MKTSKLKIKFGIPVHGWVPVDFSSGDYNLKFNASDVPVDPFEILIEALSNAISGQSGEVFWHLEPEGYFFVFGFQNEAFFLQIDSIVSSSFGVERTHEFKIYGNLFEIILPFWRALRDFESHEYPDPSWPIFPKEKLQNLTTNIEVIKEDRKNLI